MQSRIEEIRAGGGEVLAVSVDTSETTTDKLGGEGFDFPLLSDPDGEAIDAYGVRHIQGGIGGVDIARPATFLIDREGRIAWRDLTDNWRIRPRPRVLVEKLAALP